MGFWNRWFHNGEGSSRAKRYAKNGGVHLLFSGILVAVAIILIIYVVVFVHNPNKKYMNGKNTKCQILAAEKSCWRRKLLSSARIEEGRHICWLFIVTSEKVFSKVQYMHADDFPEEHDGCNSAESCGLEEWPCRVSKDDPKDIALRWAYPLKEVIYCCVGIFCTLLFGGLALWGFYKERNVDDENSEKDVSPDEPVPFSFRTRLPTWMRKDPLATTMPAPAAMA